MFRKLRFQGLVTRADRARDAKQWDKAARLYRRELHRNPTRSSIWVQYGHALKESGKLAEAEGAYLRAIAQEPTNADAHLQLGHALKLTGKVEHARSAYLRAFARDPMPEVIRELSGLGWSGHELAELHKNLTHPDNPLRTTESYGYDIACGEKSSSPFKDLSAEPAESKLNDEQSKKLQIDKPAVSREGTAQLITTSLQLEGWAVARDGVEMILVSIDGMKIGTAKYGLRRPDVYASHQDWPNSLLSGYAISIPGVKAGEHLVRVELCTKSGSTKAEEFKLFVEPDQEVHAPWKLRKKISRAEITYLENSLSSAKQHPSFVIIISPSGDQDILELKETIASLRSQAYGHWRVIIICEDDVSRAELSVLLIGECPERLCFVTEHEAGSFSNVSETSDGEDPFVVTLSPGDVLGCDALLRVAAFSVSYPNVDFLYSDELRRSPITGALEPFFKPQWSPDLLLATNYVGRIWGARTSLLGRVGVELNDFHRLGEYDAVLRCTEEAKNIGHIPYVLCERGTGVIDEPAKERSALIRAMERQDIDGEVIEGCASGYYGIRRKRVSSGLVSIIIPTGGRVELLSKCLHGVLNKTGYQNIELILLYNTSTRPEAFPYFDTLKNDTRIRIINSNGPFNFSRICNLGADAARGEFLLFLNDDIEVIESDWVDRMIEHAERPEVGVVGARLLYPDGKIQHGGIFWVAGQGGRHAFRYLPATDPGYFGLALTTRNVLAVTGACIMLRRSWFEKIGRFDENHTIVNNDVDLSLRCWRHGGRVVYEPSVCLVHHELATRHDLPDDYDEDLFDQEWSQLLNIGDPYYNSNLAHDRDDYSVHGEPAEAVFVKRPLFTQNDIKRILALKLDHIGDLITVIPALRRLKSHFPAAELYVLAPANHRDLVANLIPDIKEVIPFEFFHQRSELGERGIQNRELEQLRERLVPYQFDLAIDLRKHLDARKVMRFTGAQWFAGYDQANRFPWLDIAIEWDGDNQLVSKRAHISDDMVRLVDAIAAATLQKNDTLPTERMSNDLFDDHIRKFVCVHPGVGSETRRWPAQHFATLIDLLIANHDVDVVLVGGMDESEIANDVLLRIRNKDAVRSLVGKISLDKLPTVIAGGILFVGNNSGPNHIAAALGVPTVGVYSGVVDAQEWGPFGQSAVAVQRRMSCSPCYIATANQCPRGLICLKELYPAAVYEVCRQLLLRSAGSVRQGRSGEAHTVSNQYSDSKLLVTEDAL